MPSRDQALDLRGAVCQRSIRREVGRKPLTDGFEVSTRTLRRPPDRGSRRCAAIKENLDSGTARYLGRAKALGPAARHCRDGSFDMLAGAEPVDAVVDAAA